ncbi:MAG: SDR family NAD(P)-dependent oxidoreductase [Candidatus Xenobiia bacterium LiM19]
MKPEPTSRIVPLAIIGIGCIFPGAEDHKQFWSNIRNGVDSITSVPDTHWKIEDYFDADQKAPDRTYGSRGGFITPVDFDPLEFAIAPNTMEAIDTSQLLGLLVAKKALQDAGYGNGKEFNRRNTSVILGVTGTLELVIPLGARLGHPKWRKALKEVGVKEELMEQVIQKISESYVEWQESSFPGLLGNVVAGRIANYFDLGGTNCVVDAACASSLSALNLAHLELASGKSDMVLAGGVDTFNDIFMYMCFSKTPALSPTGDIRPFSCNCDGTVLGEGLGMVVLKRLHDAERDGDRIYAVIKNIGTSSDGKGAAVFAPQPGGQARAMQKAYEYADISPRSIELVEAHGTGTKVGDLAEIKSLCSVYQSTGDDRAWCALGSVKSQIGHTKAAAGVAGLIKAALAIYHHVLPPTIKVEKPMDELAGNLTPFYINTEKRPWIRQSDLPRRAALSSFGFGGSNYHCILEESPGGQKPVDWDDSVQIVAFSAGTREELKSALKSCPGELKGAELCAFAERSREAFNADAHCRLIAVIEKGHHDISRALDGALTMLEKNAGKEFWATPEGVFYASGPKPGLLGVLFPGQGSQYVGMLRDLACQFPQMQDVLSEAHHSFEAHKSDALKESLMDYIYPHPSFDREEREGRELALRDTKVAQPALGAVDLGAFKVLRYFGIMADAFAGHSYGELVALAAAGRMSSWDLHLLSARRGNLMTGIPGDLGSMVAVLADIDTVRKSIEEHALNVVIANKNAPSQTVLSGATPEIKHASEVLSESGIKNTILPVSAAFHSSLVADAQIPFAGALQKVEFRNSVVPVFSNTTGISYPEDPAEARTMLAGQLAQPVEFVKEITTMYEFGVRTFIEVGPGSRMTGLVKSILGETGDYRVMALDSSAGKRSGIHDLAKMLAFLTVSGYGVDLSLWNPATLLEKAEWEKPKPRMVIKLCGANYVKPSKKSTAGTAGSLREQKPAAQMKNGREDRSTLKVQEESAGAREREHISSEKGMYKPPSAVHPVINIPAQPRGVPESRDGSLLVEALRVTQENMRSLQNIQEQTARMHMHFLQNQDIALRTFQELAEQQQHLFQQSLGLPSVLAGGRELPAVHQFMSEEKMIPCAGVQYAAVPFTGVPAAAVPCNEMRAASVPASELKRDLQASPDISPSPAPLKAQEEPSPRGEVISETLIAIVSEKTGYPAEMLDLSMSLDADLGIDSIKRVEIFSALKEAVPELPAFKTEQMNSLKTLGDITGFMAHSMPSAGEAPKHRTAAAARMETSADDALTESLSDEAVSTILIELVAEKTGYPAEMLELSMSLDADLGIDSIKRVEIFSALKEAVPELPAFRTDQMNSLKTLGDITEFMARSMPSTGVAPHRSAAAGVHGEGPAGAASAKPLTDEPVSTVLVGLVAEKTGYPSEMLELSMNLDSDLGIDSIKRVEIFSALRDALPELPAFKTDQMNSLKTLGDIVTFITSESSTTRSSKQAGSPVTETHRAAERVSPQKEQSSEQAASVERAEDLQRMVLSSQPLERGRAALAIAEGLEILITDDQSPLSGKISEILRKKNYRPRTVNLEEGSAVTLPSTLGGLIIVAPEKNADDLFLKKSFMLLQSAAPALRRAGREGGSFFVTISRLDGIFGIHSLDRDMEPRSGGLAGLSKTARHEWPEVHCKALDLAQSFKSIDRAAADIVEEIFLHGPVEVGISDKGKSSLEISSAPLSTGKGICPVEEGDIVLVTGGARGVTAECAIALMESFPGSQKPVIVLLGRSTAPEPEPDWLASLNDEAAIKKEIMHHGRGTVTPQYVKEQYDEITAHREMRKTMSRFASLGAKVYYRSVDIRAKSDLESVISEIRGSIKAPIRGLIHGAGVIADRLIEEKTDREFDRVYSTKVAGLMNLLSLLSEDDLRLMVFFSSTTGRYGRKGQVDYAVANEVMNKIAERESKLRPECRVLAMNWGPWDGGMVTPPLRKIFQDEGIGLIPLNAGADLLVREIWAPAQESVEIAVLGNSAKAAEINTVKSRESATSMDVAFEREIGIDDYSFLKSHVLDGNAVLPVSMMIEWLAHGAIQTNPGLSFSGFNEMKVLKGLKFGRRETPRFQVLAGKALRAEGGFYVPVELRSAIHGPEYHLNARAEMVLGAMTSGGARTVAEKREKPYPHSLTKVYSEILFHGNTFQGIEHIDGCSDNSITATVKPAPRPQLWLAEPLRNTWLADPLVIDCTFQLMILWSYQKYGSLSLPVYIGRYRQFKKFPKGQVRILIEVVSHSSGKARARIEYIDGSDALLARMEDYECIIEPSLEKAFRRNHLDEPVMMKP